MIRDPRALARRCAGPLLGLAVVVGIFAAVLPHFADYRAVWRAMTHLSGREWAVIAVSVGANVATGGLPWMAAVPDLGYRRAMLLTQTSGLMTTVLPMGEAVGFATQVAMLRRWRYVPSVVTAGFVLVAVWNQGANIVIPVAAVAALGAGHTNPLIVTVSLVAVVVLLVLIGAAVFTFRSDEQARRLGALCGRVATRALAVIGRPPRVGWGEELADMRAETVGVVAGHWPFLTVATLANQLTLFGVMLACLHATGVSGVSFFEALAAWSLGRLVGSIAITPGGLGLQELGLTGALAGFGGGADAVVATALLYRVLTFVPTVVVGSACALVWRRDERSRRSVLDGVNEADVGEPVQGQLHG
jgi:putative heme transporter